MSDEMLSKIQNRPSCNKKDKLNINEPPFKQAHKSNIDKENKVEQIIEKKSNQQMILETNTIQSENKKTKEKSSEKSEKKHFEEKDGGHNI